MPKEHAKVPRNCVNETQIRDERTGAFLRRRDAGNVTVSLDARQMFRDALAQSKEFFRAARLRRRLRA